MASRKLSIEAGSVSLARSSLVFLIYSSQLFIGTPVPVVVLQAAALVIIGLSVLVRAIKMRHWIFPVVFWEFSFLFLGYIGFSMILGLERAQTPLPVMIRFLQVFFTTLSLPLFAYSFQKLKIMGNDKILKHILYATITYCVLKMAVVAIVAIFNIPYGILFAAFWAVFNTGPTVGEIAFGIIRFMAPTDFLSPFILYYVLVYMSGWSRVFLASLLCASIFVTFSRFIWLEGVFALVMFSFSLSRGQILAALVSLLVVAPALGALPMPVIESRFSSANVSRSDDLRTLQYDALTQDTDQHVLFGHGFASFPFKMVRDPNTPYIYELQWLSLAYQMGLIGIIFLLGLLYFNSSPLFGSRSAAALPILVLFGFSLFSGFANPSLIGRSAGVGFAFVYCLGILVRDRSKQVQSRTTSLPRADLALG